MTHSWSSGLGVVMLVLGVGFGTHSIRASVSALLYHSARYGLPPGSVDAVLERCEVAHSWYRYNHVMCVWVAEQAYVYRCDDAGRDRRDRLEQAFQWGGRALALNPRSSQARMMEVHRLVRISVPSAIRRWEEYVEWNYWSPHSHLPLVDLYARAGMYEKAVEEVRFLTGTECEEPARNVLRYWWEREKQEMKELSGRPSERPRP